jgi:hypothetical protein
MKYKITQAYCWYNRGSMIVRMYFINYIPFTFDELPKEVINDLEIIKKADEQLRWEPESLYQKSFYLIDEEIHPCLFPVDLENPEHMPQDDEEFV